MAAEAGSHLIFGAASSRNPHRCVDLGRCVGWYLAFLKSQEHPRSHFDHHVELHSALIYPVAFQ